VPRLYLTTPSWVTLPPFCLSRCGMKCLYHWLFRHNTKLVTDRRQMDRQTSTSTSITFIVVYFVFCSSLVFLLLLVDQCLPMFVIVLHSLYRAAVNAVFSLFAVLIVPLWSCIFVLLFHQIKKEGRNFSLC